MYLVLPLLIIVFSTILEPQSFKDSYEGRIVISTGKIATDTNETDEEWEIKYDKEGITI